MAFRNIKGLRIKCMETGRLYILSDCLAIYEEGVELPTVYEWRDCVAIAESKNHLTFTTISKTYKLAKSNFENDEEYLSALAIIEGACGDYHISYSHGPRILSTKNFYMESDLPMNSYTATGVVDEKEMSACLTTVMYASMSTIMWLLAIMCGLAVFLLLHFTVGTTLETVGFFLLISVISSVIVMLLLYFLRSGIANRRFSLIASSDPAVRFPIAYTVGVCGFAEVENMLFARDNYIPWNQAEYYMETDSMIIVMKGKQPLLKMPKRIFSNEEVEGIVKLIDSVIPAR